MNPLGAPREPGGERVAPEPSHQTRPGAWAAVLTRQQQRERVHACEAEKRSALGYRGRHGAASASHGGVGSAGRALTSPGVTHGAPGYAPTSGCHDSPWRRRRRRADPARGEGERAEGAVSEREERGASPACPLERKPERTRPEPTARPPPPPPPLPSRPAPARSPPSSRLSPQSPSEAPFGSRAVQNRCARASPSLLLAPASRAPASLQPAPSLTCGRTAPASPPAPVSPSRPCLLSLTHSRCRPPCPCNCPLSAGIIIVPLQTQAVQQRPPTPGLAETNE
ncbi:vegetative cell wall protein gp1-like [Rattus rattus]|uniref:vegetative cell wall protein gp1-like n=1 Tax=Rattus rattus TaxID=10117 RepID=UPI0013F2D291|nr:vegetative cell wall protein gp1-like [Rattus rattus]